MSIVPDQVQSHKLPRKTETSRTETSIKVRRSRSHALLSSWVHFLPVGVSFGILQLSFRNVYWADANVKNENAKLAGLQVAAKLHEMLILLSMAYLVLHHARRLMVTPGGMPFGLLEATYQSALSGHPWTMGYWNTWKQLLRSPTTSWRVWRIVILLAVSAFLAMFVGPASAVAVIPQLGWWHDNNLVGPTYIAGQLNNLGKVSLYIPTLLFPTQVSNDSLPGSFCSDVALDVNHTCPSAGLAEVQRSIQIAVEFDPFHNDTFSDSDAIVRRMLSLDEWWFFTATMPNYVLATFSSLLTVSNYTNQVPFTVEIKADSAAPFSPLVGVGCTDTRSDIFARQYSYEVGGMAPKSQNKGNYVDPDKSGSFDIRSVWTEEELSTSIFGSEVRWKDITSDTNVPVLLVLIRHGNNVTVCSVQSWWTQTSQWILSTSTYDMATNFTWFQETNDASRAARSKSGSSMYGYPYMLNQLPIQIHEDWAETLNAFNGSARALEAVLDNENEPLSKTIASTTKEWPANEPSYRERVTAQIISKAIVNGLSRIGSQYAADNFVYAISQKEIVVCNTADWCSAGPLLLSTGGVPVASVANCSREGVETYVGSETFSHDPYDSWSTDRSPLMRSFAKPKDADAIWTRVEFPYKRLGRAYALEGIASYLAAALLCLHAVIVLTHVAYRVFVDFDTYDFGQSLGQLLVLSMGDGAPVGNRMWTRQVAVVPFQDEDERDRLKLVMMDSGDEVPSRSNDEVLHPAADSRSSSPDLPGFRLEDLRSQGRYQAVGSFHDT